jgi:hypothetical protein
MDRLEIEVAPGQDIDEAIDDSLRFFDLWERDSRYRAGSRYPLPWIEARADRLPPVFGFR